MLCVQPVFALSTSVRPPDSTSVPKGAKSQSLLQEQEYLKKSREVWETVWDMSQTHDAWKLESGQAHTSLEHGMVHSRVFAGSGKVYRLQVSCVGFCHPTS